MAFSFFSQPYIRAGIHHLFATLLFTGYASRISPYIDAIPFLTLFFQTAAFFLAVYLLRFSFYLIGSKINALIDISLYTLAALFYAFWHQIFYNFPLESNVKVAFGILLIGSIITIDLAICHARAQQGDPSAFIKAPKVYIPLVVQISFAVIFFLFSLTMILSLIISRDLVWISQYNSLSLDIDDINSLIRTFLLVTLIFGAYAVIIAQNAIALVKRQLAYQIQALEKASQQDFSSKVPMNSLGEFSIIAFFTNNMLLEMQLLAEKRRQKRAQKSAKNQESKEAKPEQKPEPQPEPVTVPDTKSADPKPYQEDCKTNLNETAVISNLAVMIAGRDGTNRAHLMRIQHYVKTLAIRLMAKEDYKQSLTIDSINLLYQCAPLYDVGKIAIPDNILKKPGKLTQNQLAIIKTHAQIGADALHIEGQTNKFYTMARELALTHHEWWNGTGYPNHLAGNDIPIAGRIMALADTYDALISKRGYRAAYEHEEAKEIILSLRGVQFAPDVVDAFVEAENQFKDINRRYRDELLYTLVG